MKNKKKKKIEWEEKDAILSEEEGKGEKESIMRKTKAVKNHLM